MFIVAIHIYCPSKGKIWYVSFPWAHVLHCIHQFKPIPSWLFLKYNYVVDEWKQ